MKSLEDVALEQRWRQRHPAEKTLVAFGLLAVSLAAPSWLWQLACFLLSAALLLISARVPVRSYLRALLPPLAFLCVGAATLFVSLDFGDGAMPRLELALGAWKTALPLFARSLAAFNSLLLFALTTPIADALHFFRRCGMPESVLEAALLTYNMFRVLYESMVIMERSQEARLGYAGLRASYRSLGLLAGNLLIQALARAKRLETGLSARGFEGKLKVLVDFTPLSWPRFACIAVLLLALATAMRVL